MRHAFTLVFTFVVAVAFMARPIAADQRDPRLDALFDELQSTASAIAARAATTEIWAIWQEVDDPAAARALQRGMRALRLGALDRAEAAFDRAIAARADFAEAWNQRATVRFLDGDLAGSIADIRATLALEPRHFGALSGLGMIYDRLDEPARALESFGAALAVNPHLDGVRERVEALERRLDGAPI